MERPEKAVELKHGGNNCCQAVLLAFADELPLDEEKLLAVGVAFGSGMGGTAGTCGALCGAEMVLGLKKYAGKKMHSEAQKLYDDFAAKAGATVCRELKGTDTGKPICSCEDCVRYAAALVGEMV